MLRSEKHEVSFVDIVYSHAEKKWEKHWLNKVFEMVQWRPFKKKFKKLYSESEGRPAWDPVVLFRCLLLAEWHTLSDRQLEEAIEFRYDFRKFAGISFDREAPDSTTFVVFRERIQHLWKELIEEINRQLEQDGFKVRKAVAVDATLVEAHSKPKKNKNDNSNSTGGDSDGSWRGFPMKKSIDNEGNEVTSRRPALFGYKVNISTSVKHGFVSKVSVCKASEHETHHMKKLISRGTKEVYADKGYVGKRGYLKNRNIRDGIQAKATRGNPLSRKDIKRNKRITDKRRIVEGVFGSWKQWYDWRKTRFIGLIKNTLAVCLTAIAWNMKKWARYA